MTKVRTLAVKCEPINIDYSVIDRHYALIEISEKSLEILKDLHRRAWLAFSNEILYGSIYCGIDYVEGLPAMIDAVPDEIEFDGEISFGGDSYQIFNKPIAEIGLNEYASVTEPIISMGATGWFCFGGTDDETDIEFSTHSVLIDFFERLLKGEMK